MLRFVFFLFFTCMLSTFVYGQSYQLTGIVMDEIGNPIPFASIYKKDSPIGTSANSEGVFKLRLPPGEHELLIRAIGYKQAVEQVVVSQDHHIQVMLPTESYVLDEVVIGNGEDPAYAIIRQAIRNRRKHLNEAQPYTAKVYI